MSKFFQNLLNKFLVDNSWEFIKSYILPTFSITSIHLFITESKKEYIMDILFLFIISFCAIWLVKSQLFVLKEIKSTKEVLSLQNEIKEKLIFLLPHNMTGYLDFNSKILHCNISYPIYNYSNQLINFIIDTEKTNLIVNKQTELHKGEKGLIISLPPYHPSIINSYSVSLKLDDSNNLNVVLHIAASIHLIYSLKDNEEKYNVSHKLENKFKLTLNEQGIIQSFVPVPLDT